MKISISILLALTLLIACKGKENASSDTEAAKNKSVTDNQDDDAWISLFDGTSFDNWRGYLMDTMAPGWTIEEGTMAYTPGANSRNNIITKKQYTDFVLSLDWKIAEGGNSGIMWGVYEDPALPEPYQSGPEIQVLDNKGHPDGKPGSLHEAGSLFGMISPSADVSKPAGEWNHFLITIDYKNNRATVQLNGTEIENFPLQGEKWDEMLASSKFKDWPEFGKHQTGYIALQDHGSKVCFKNIKIKELQ